MVPRSVQLGALLQETPEREQPSVRLEEDGSVLCAAMTRFDKRSTRINNGHSRMSRNTSRTASVERLDVDNQDITLKGPDGSLETIMVSNPEQLSRVKVGDRIVITRPQGLAVSVERES